eukprot:Skav202030  [mRNA]  locus=scaffold1138:216968:217264:+ [translate_table: standard]
MDAWMLYKLCISWQLCIHWISGEAPFERLPLWSVHDIGSSKKLKMRANTNFALQVILIWVVLRTMHQLVPRICKVGIELVVVGSILFHNSCIGLIMDE